MVSYLTIPPGVEPKKLPLVLLIHGGPWDRDDDSYDPEVQFLANRGYAVLQANYRGSTGFGINFLNAGTKELGLGTVEDLFDAVQWAIDNGVADPKRIAAMGGSMGGYATLRALEMRPDLFACGVDAFGPGDLATTFRSFPSYWSNIPTVGAAARVMPITTKSGIAPFRRFTTSTKFARRFSLLREKTIRV